MNLVPHGILLQVTVWLINFQHGFRLCSGGEPGYLDFDNLPETNFSCLGKVIGGYYADVETGCQMFHVCTIGQKDEIMDIKFLCLNGTVFDQETRVCERVDEVDCSKSERFYNLNLELYGNNAVTLSLHEVPDDEGEPTESIDDQHPTTLRPTTTTTTTTTQRPTNSPATATTTVYHQQNTGYSQHYGNQPLYSTPQSSQSKSLYDDKNSGYHHQYIFHNGEQANNQATSFQLFSNQGVSSTTNQPQIHQARYGTTSSPQIILNGPSTVEPLYHGVSSTIQTLLNSNGNNPSYINPLFHNHGIPSTTEHFTVHSSNPRETQEYHEDGEQSEDRGRRPLQAVQSTNQGKISKLSISPIPTESIDDEDLNDSAEERTPSSHSPKIATSFLPTPTSPEPTARSFYPTPRTSPKPDSGPTQVIRHIHLSPSAPIPHLKPQQITINLPPPDIQRIVQNPSPLLPSQSRVIVTAKASVSDESGRPLNTSELVVLPLPTIPASYDDYKEGDESFDPFYRDVPKIRRSRRVPSVKELLENANRVHVMNQRRQVLRRMARAVLEDQTDYEDDQEAVVDYEYPASDDSLEDEDTRPLLTDSEETMDIATIKANFKKFKALLLGRRVSGEIPSERKTYKEHFSSVKSKSAYDGIDEISDGGIDEDDSSLHREMKMMMQTEPEDIENAGNQNSNGDENSGDLNSGDNLDSELTRMTNTSEVDKIDDVRPVVLAKETEAEKKIDTGSLTDIHKTDDQPDTSTVESGVKESYGYESIAHEKESVNRSVMVVRDSDNTANGETVESSRDAKSLRAEGETESRKTSDEESAANTRESDAEEHIEPGTMLNTKKSDVEEYVGSKSTSTTEEAEVEGSVEPKINAKESDPKEYVRLKSPVNTEELDAPEAVLNSGKPTPIPNTQKSSDHEVSIDSGAEKHDENTAELIPSDKAVVKINLKTEPTGDDERPTSEQKTTTETTAGKVEFEPEAKVNDNQQEVNQRSINTSNNEEDSIQLKMTLDVGELREKEISEPTAEKTDALIDVEEVEKPKPSMKPQESAADETDQFESIDLEPEEIPKKSNADVSSKDSDVKEHDESQPERSEVISEVPQEAEESVMADDLNLRQSVVDQKPEVKEKLTDHAMGKKPDSLVEKVESVAEMEDSTLEEKSETSIRPEEEKEPKLPQLDSEKSKPTIASGWKPSKARTIISRFPKTENRGPINNYACTESPSHSSSKKTDPKTKVEGDNGLRLSKFLSRSGAGNSKDKPKLLGVRERAKFSIESTAEAEYSNNAQLPQSKVKKQENHPEEKEPSTNGEPDNSSSHEAADDVFAEKSSESPNKITSDLLDCSDSLEKHRRSSYENYRDEYDDYASEEYISESRESEPDERRGIEVGSQETTSEYNDSGYISGDEYSTSGEDYVPVSGEPYSTEDSKPTVSNEDYSTEGYNSGDKYSTSGEDYVPVSGEPYSTEDSRSTMSYEDYSTEGILKFTDEIPEPMRKQLKQKNRAATRAKVSSEDYVDDNYEPEHYKETSAEKNQTLVEYSDEKDDKVSYESSSEGKLNDEAVDNITSTTETTTTTTTTTTARPTPPSLFRPFSVRKNYNYIPPTTTPNSVVIKHRFGLLNPRPAKPIKSYNDLAPKPVIRKSPLLFRKPYGTESTTEKLTMPQRRIDDFEDSTIWTSTEYIDEDEAPRESNLTRAANDVSLNKTRNEEKTDVPIVNNETLSTDPATKNNSDTSLDLSSGTEKILDINSAYLSTPYPLLKATTSGSLVVEETEDRKFADTEVATADEPTTETPNVTQVEASSELSASSSSTTEGPIVDSVADKKSLKIDRDHGEEAMRNSKVPFSCIDKEPYRFYGDPRDCRLFHYCSPGFTAKQMLDFRFVCEDATTFDQESQSCRYNLENLECANRQW